MRLKLFEKAFSKIGQIFKKMASSSNYQKLNCTANTTTFDPEIEKICGSSYTPSLAQASVGSSDFSSAYISPDASPSWQLDLEKLNLKNPTNAFDSLDLSNIHVIKPPSDPWNDTPSIKTNGDTMKTHNSFSSSYGNFRAPLSNSTNISTFSTIFSDFTYSILSNTNDEKPIWEDNGWKHDQHQMQTECIYKDFEMNGKTTEISSFEPRVMSTPFTSRRFEYHEHFEAQQENVFFEDISAQECFEMPQPYLPSGRFETNEISANIPARNNFNKIPEKRRTSKVKPLKKSLADHCVFCKNNGALPAVYTSHKVMDAKGRCLCPMLRQYKCPICNADGDNAHTTKYCPKRKIFTESDMKKFKPNSKSKSLKF